MSFTLGMGSLFQDAIKNKQMKGSMSAVTDKKALKNVLEQKSAAEMTGDEYIDTSQQSKLARKDIKEGGGLSTNLEKEKSVDWSEKLAGLGRLSELTGKQPRDSGFRVSSQTLSGAGRLGTGLTLKDILKYRP